VPFVAVVDARAVADIVDVAVVVSMWAVMVNSFPIDADRYDSSMILRQRRQLSILQHSTLCRERCLCVVASCP